MIRMIKITGSEITNVAKRNESWGKHERKGHNYSTEWEF